MIFADYSINVTVTGFAVSGGGFEKKMYRAKLHVGEAGAMVLSRE